MAEFTSSLGTFIGALERQQKAGLIAAAETYMPPVKERLLQGYTTGDFTTGHVAGSVKRGDPEPAADGGWQIAVGSDVDYALYWEVGHVNIFVAKKGGFFNGYVRIPIWEPTMIEMRERLKQVMVEEIKALDGAL